MMQSVTLAQTEKVIRTLKTLEESGTEKVKDRDLAKAYLDLYLLEKELGAQAKILKEACDRLWSTYTDLKG